MTQSNQNYVIELIKIVDIGIDLELKPDVFIFLPTLEKRKPLICLKLILINIYFKSHISFIFEPDMIITSRQSSKYDHYE